jgi:hypothetical protein
MELLAINGLWIGIGLVALGFIKASRLLSLR